MAPGIMIEERHRGSDLAAGWSLAGFDIAAFVKARESAMTGGGNAGGLNRPLQSPRAR